MALKFLNKKGWHTGSLRNIENVWKAEQKHEAEQKKLEELKKQIQEERERNEFIQLQEQAGLVPRQEKLGFLYDSGLSVGRPSSSKDGGSGVAFKALEEAAPGKPAGGDGASASDKQQAAVPGALFEDKPHSANDAWRKLHSDPLLMIRQREQEALARIKNNPVQMAMIRKSVEKKEEKGKDHGKKHQKKYKHGKTRHHKHSSKQLSDSETDGDEYRMRRASDRKDSEHHRSKAKETSDDESRGRERQTRADNNRSDRKDSERHRHRSKAQETSDDESRGRERQTRADNNKSSKYRERSPSGRRDDSQDVSRNHHSSRDSDVYPKERGDRISYHGKSRDSSAVEDRSDSRYKRQNVAPKLSEEERAARLREMQADAEVHEEQRWKRLKKAEEDDALEATRASQIKGRNFLEATHKSVYGTEKGGSSTIEESVRRRTHYLQGRSEVGNGNAFRR